MDEKIILFDGYCNFCSFWVNFIIKSDLKKRFKFSCIQSDGGREILQRKGIKENITETVILLEGNNYFTKSTASLKIIHDLSFPVNLLSLFLIIPSPVRDFLYDLIAKNRYKIFGKRNNCRIPSGSEKERFLK